MGKTCQNTQASNWQCDFNSGRFAPESVLSIATELIWPRPTPPALTAVLSSAGSHSRCILGFPWLHCFRLCLLGRVRGFSFRGRVSLNGLSQVCCGRFKGWTFFFFFFLFDGWIFKPETFHTAAVVIHEPLVSMFIFLDCLPQDWIGFITFRRAGLLVAKGGSWVHLLQASPGQYLLSIAIKAGHTFWLLHFPTLFKRWNGECGLWLWVVLAGQGRALPVRNARHSGGVGGWAASSSLNVLSSDCTGMKCMSIACLPLEINYLHITDKSFQHSPLLF